MQKHDVKTKNIDVSKMIKVSILGAIGYVLMMFDFPLPMFPAFLQIDLGDLPALIGSFALGPLSGVGIEFIKCLLYFITGNSTTAGVGDLSNFVIGSTFVGTAGLIYKYNKTRFSAMLACVVGTIFMTVLGVFSNYFIMIPFYASAFGMPIDAIVQMGSKVNASITDLFTLVIFGIVPFNILKGAMLSLITMFIYKKISPLLKK